jgi:tetratricopeptide (TPR) repeat protein
MKPLLLTVVDQRCENPSCGRVHLPAGAHSFACSECQSPLTPVWGVDWRAAGLAAAALTAIALISLLGARWYLARRAAEQEAQLHLKPQLIALLRTAYQDGTVSPQERADIDSFVLLNRFQPATVQALEKDIAGKVEASNRSLARGNALMARRMVAEARNEFRLATEVDPENSMAWANLGAAESTLGRRAEAKTGLDRALQLDPANWLAHYNLGLLAVREGDRTSAFHHFEQALATRDPGGQERRALVHELLSEPVLAALRQDPRFEELLGSGGATLHTAQGEHP